MSFKEKILVRFIICLSFIFLIFVLFWFENPFVNSYTIEAGDTLTIQDILKKKNARNPQILTTIDSSITNHVGKHQLKVKGNDGEFMVELKVQDTISPTATVTKKTFWLGDKINASDFVKNINDHTKVKVSFLKKVDFKKIGSQNIQIKLEDEGKNITKYNTTLTIKKDTVAPIISAPNVIRASKNDNIIYKKDVTVKDNRDKEVKLEVDHSKVDTSKAGTYNVIFKAKDQAGNQSQKTVKIVILSESTQQIKKQAYQYADKLLQQLCNNKQTKKQKLVTICKYIRANLTYVGIHQGNLEDYYLDALNGFKTLRGDCLVNNAMARVVCERLDIQTIGVQRANYKDNHYWFMANTGDGWYHYDCFRHKSGLKIYGWTDKQMADYNKKYHTTDFDHSLYPRTPDK